MGAGTSNQKSAGSPFCGGGCGGAAESDDEIEQESYIMPQHKIDAVARWMDDVKEREPQKVVITHEINVADTQPGTIPDEDVTDEELGLVYKEDSEAVRPPLTSDNLKRWLMYIQARPQLH